MDNTSFFADESTVTVNPNMKVYPNPFPEKMARAVAFFEKNGPPPGVEYTKKEAKRQAKKAKKSPLSTLQIELRAVYAIEPTEQQMRQVKDFLVQLFGEKLNDLKIEQEEVLMA